ncbi:hypothetical protein BDY17DRAFT_325071 [Neohortaea acidophila]|uniref:DUF1682-domain-containing protein n=1 Tax=Neohortaea acidophila TaxID=245834 RepID=A0A6A6PRU2_9PEZI|nr:uncharacterized protein BDY17DRAFT_325071 [Neohortaea acidophila]KAF2482819.1 hypothetical protein BDY17DRAFT_325071 [Neohortaea acidophila]
MALLVKQLYGLFNPSAPAPAAPADPDFADFAAAPNPAAPSHASNAFPGSSAAPTAAAGGLSSFISSPYGIQGRPYTKWYRVWERVTYKDFYQEFVILPILLVVVAVNVVGTQINKARMRAWAAAFVPLLEAEYAQVGQDKEAASSAGAPEQKLKQGKMSEWSTYATGRQNAAFTDVKISLHKRFNPLLWVFELVLSFLFESIPTPMERMLATTYVFDGKEKLMLPDATAGGNSSYDGFVWAVVHKDFMQQLRNDRYDLSLTATRDNAKLPEWATVMSESSEVTDALLTPELVKAIEQCGEDLEALIITDQPIDAPKKLNELVPRKRLTLTTKLPTTSTIPNLTPLFTLYLRLPDTLVQTAHFRPEALRKIRATREEEQRKIKRLDEEEKAEERKSASDKAKKEERERKLKGMGAEEQRKFLEREKAEERKRGQKKNTMRG